MIKLKNIDASFKNWIRTQAIGFGMAKGSRILFVDGINGSDSYSGLDDPATAKKTVRKAIEAANAQDVIYIGPKGTPSDGEPSYYQDASSDPVITSAKHGLALIGIGHAGLLGMPYDVCIKAYATESSSICPGLTVYAPFCAIENLAFNRGNGNVGILFDGDSATHLGYGGAVYNCYFRNCRGSGATGDTGGAIYVVGGAQNTTIERVMFYNCRIGIAAKSGTNVTEGLTIRDASFRASNANLISADIYLYFQGQNYTIIDDIRIGHDVPSVSGGHGACIIAVGGAEIGEISNVYAQNADGTVNATTGTIIRVPATMGKANIWMGANAASTTT